MRIAELAERVGVPTTTVRYYERVGLLDAPQRTASGYRDYGEDAAARLLFVARSRSMGLSCQQITELLPVWDGTNCGAQHERSVRHASDFSGLAKPRRPGRNRVLACLIADSGK